MIFITAQIFSGISGICYMISGKQSTHNRIMYFQILDCLATILSNILLGGYAGAVICTVSLVRNMLSYIGKMNKKVVVCIMFSSVTLTIIYADMSHWYNWMLLASNVTYTFGVCYGKCKRTKQFMLLDMTLWIIYNVIISSYGGLIFNIISIVTIIKSLSTDKKIVNLIS